MTMTLPTNDLATRELSMDDLDAIAGGNIFGDIWHGIEHGAHAVGSGLKSFFTNPVVAGIAGGILLVGAIATGGSALKQN